MVFDKLFAWRKKKKIVPDIPFGRYSDNNKKVAKVSRWTEGDNYSNNKNTMKAWMPFLITCEMMNNRILCMNATKKKDRFPILSGIENCARRV